MEEGKFPHKYGAIKCGDLSMMRNCCESQTTYWDLDNTTMDKMNEEIRQYILSEFLPGERASNLKDDTPLRTSGILNSITTLRLVTFVEEHYGIEVEAHEASVENFDSISSIASLIMSKKADRS